MRVVLVVAAVALVVGCNRKGFDAQERTDDDPVTDTDEPPPNPDFELIFVQQPGDTNAGLAFSTAPILEIHRKDDGSLVTGDALTTASIRITIAAGNGILRGTTTLSATAGRADFTAAFLAPELGGTMTLRASADPGLSAVSRAITVALPAFSKIDRKAGPEHSRGHVDGAVVSNNIASVARINAPFFAAYDSTGIYFTDVEDNTVRKYTINNGLVTTVAGTPYQGGADDTGAGTFAGPSGIAVNGDTIYVSEIYNSDIRKITKSTGAVSSWINTSHTEGLANGTGATARLLNPYGMTLSNNSLFVADCGTGTIRLIDTGTAVVTQYAGDGTNNGDANGNGVAAKMGCVTDVAYSPSELFTVDGSVIRTIDTTASTHHVDKVKDAFGSVGLGYIGSGNTMYLSNYDSIDLFTVSTATRDRYAGGDDGHVNGDRLDAAFSQPTGLVAAFDRIFVMDRGNSAVRVIDPATNQVSTLIGVPGSGRGIQDSVGDAARFRDIRGIAADSTTVYVADEFCVRAVNPQNGSVTTFAGAGRQGGNANASGTDARFGQLIDIATDGKTLFVSDSDAASIKAIDIATRNVTTLAGSGSFGYVDGVGESAAFAAVQGLTYAQGKLYVTDANVIRVVDVATREVSTFAGTYQSQGCINGDAVTARTDNPHALVVYNGGLYFMEAYCNTLRRIDLKTREITTVAGDGTEPLGQGTDIDFPDDEVMDATTDGQFIYLIYRHEGMVRRIDPSDGYRMAYYVGDPNDPREQNGAIGQARVVNMQAALWRPDGLWIGSAINLRVVR